MFRIEEMDADMNIGQTEMLPIVEPVDLELAYAKCDRLFESGNVEPETVLDVIAATFTNLEVVDVIDLFRRLFLTVQFISEIDANWDLSGQTGALPRPIPSALFEIAGTELAFEGTVDGRSSTFFARDLLEDAFLALRA